MSSFNPELLKFNSVPKQNPEGKKPPPRHAPGEKFIKGPIPWDWITAAARLPGKALHVAAAIWLLAGIKREGTVKLSASVLREMGVARNAYYRGLDQLEKAGLVSVTRGKGQLPIVKILGKAVTKSDIDVSI